MAVIKKFRIKSFKKINSIIEFENVSLAYGNRLILDNISFKVNEGVSFGMLGPNGVGKSTIFNLITGLITPKNGKIKIASYGADVDAIMPAEIENDIHRYLEDEKGWDPHSDSIFRIADGALEVFGKMVGGDPREW